MTLIGLSSGSAAHLDGPELARLTLSLGGTAVDVRAGKGHAWEADGLAGLRRAGCEVCFVGIGDVLGEAAASPGTGPLEQGLPVKVFASAGCMAPGRRESTLRHIALLTSLVGESSRVLVETHHGYASVPELVELCERAGTGILLDTMGLARIHPDPVVAAALLAPWTSYAQVKGFDWNAPDTSRHQPLATSCAEPTRDVLSAAGPLRAVTVESKAPALAEDLALLRAWYAGEPRPALAATPPTASAPAKEVLI
ncbi:hypothetical protein AMK16_32040 [Streptomyces sp. CB00455]|uniref:hypothetical protein n=1 Tax=Streptomyces sp. CB00455 TaxID=1703927 RepID=UPI000938E13B|nr:hypothetical protein [Streptomyces sp. CB00455]OKK12193.1 hypothetical protein AMK16_32040 [Streptomyces sp. CB00455]